MKQTLIEIKNLLSMINVRGDDVLYMAEAIVRVNKLIQEADKESETNG